jgi:hypothetical protein
MSGPESKLCWWLCRFSNAAVGVFGSGWAWLGVDPRGDLIITTTSNQVSNHPLSRLTSLDLPSCGSFPQSFLWEILLCLTSVSEVINVVDSYMLPGGFSYCRHLTTSSDCQILSKCFHVGADGSR